MKLHIKTTKAGDIGKRPTEAHPIKLALVSCGLGRVQRGFEISTSRWQAALSSDPRLDLKVFSGGMFPNAERVWNIARNDILNSPLGIFRTLNEKHFWNLCYRLEQTTFGIGFIPKLLSWQPDIVWTKELPLGRLLMAIRKLFRLKFKIIFANGDALEPPSYEDFDQIQHLYPDSFEKAARFGIEEEKMHLLPNCVFYATPGESREQLRRQFGFEKEDYIIICVAAWNRYQKRLDYLIREVAGLEIQTSNFAMRTPRGGDESAKAARRQGIGNECSLVYTGCLRMFTARFYISNVFVLPSFTEGLSNALIEAVMAELPVICHPHPGGKYILEDDQWLVDLSITGALANRVKILRDQPHPGEEIKRLQTRAMERFSAEPLAGEFYEMVKRVYATDTNSL